MVASAVVVGPTPAPRFVESVCGKAVGLLLVLYGVVNTFLFFKFTPVYSAVECGDQMAEMDNFELGKEIRVGLVIQVTCFNPNGYGVQVMTSRPGQVYVGKDRRDVVGQLSLVRGSMLPPQSSGDIKVHMNAKLSEELSMSLVPHLLQDPETPMYLELQFDVAISIGRFHLSAPFEKKCGMVLAGVLVNTKSRLGPMVCRDSWRQLAALPHVGEGTSKMSFSAAQMDPDRIRLGEAAKNVSILGVGGFCYIMGFVLLYQWFMTACSSTRRQYDKVGSLDMAGRQWCTRAYSGNLSEPPVESARDLAAAWQPRQCFRGMSGNLVEPPPPPPIDDNAFTRFGSFLSSFAPLSLVPARTATPFEREWDTIEWVGERPGSPHQPGCSCFVSPLLDFLSCGTTSRRVPPGGRRFGSPLGSPLPLV